MWPKSPRSLLRIISPRNTVWSFYIAGLQLMFLLLQKLNRQLTSIFVQGQIPQIAY